MKKNDLSGSGKTGSARRDFLRAGSLLLMPGKAARAEAAENLGGSQVSSSSTGNPDVVIENAEFRLVIGGDGTARSLTEKTSGQECLAVGTKTPVFSMTQYSPLAGQLILVYPAGAKTFAARTVRRQGDLLFVTFEGVPHEVVIEMNIAPHYVTFTVRETRTEGKGWQSSDRWKMPIEKLVLLQLPVRERVNFGNWLNVMWDNEVAVNLLAGNVYCRIDSHPRDGYRLLRASAELEVKTIDVTAVLIATPTTRLLDRIAEVESDLNLPRGAESRRRKEYKYSYYGAFDVTPANIDRHIEYARRGGFRTMLISYFDFSKGVGHFVWRPEYARGIDDLRVVAQKIKSAGLIPGLHIEYSKAVKSDPYVFGRPDNRLNLLRFFTLAAPLDKTANTIAVEENPSGTTLDDERRILKLGTELVSYERYVTTPPYQFTGCRRAQLGTTAGAYEAGTLFGLLDVDPFVQFVRFNQNTTIQQEVALRIAEIYKAGFEFMYFDGAEAVHPPYWFTAGWAQWVVYQALQPAPLFAEAAHRAHFTWHIMSRGNAFDFQQPEMTKAAMQVYQEVEAPWMAKDFTSINFGWMNYRPPGAQTIGTQPDMIEYVLSRAAGWDCVFSLRPRLPALEAHARTADNLEVMRRWEQARISNWLNQSQKEALRASGREHTLLIDEKGDFELVPYEQILQIAGGADRSIRAFVFERLNRVWVVYWHCSGYAMLAVPVTGVTLRLWEDLGKKELPVKQDGTGVLLPASNRRYLDCADISKSEVIRMFQESKVVSG